MRERERETVRREGRGDEKGGGREERGWRGRD